VARRFGTAPFAFAAVLLAAAFGYQQFLASVLLRERASPPSWVRFIPAQTAQAIDRSEPLFASPSLRLLFAHKALEDGDLALAARRIARLPPSPQRFALQGRLAEARGDAAAAARAYLAAGDAPEVERRVSALASAGRLDEALALQRELVARLQRDSSQVDALANAWLESGRLEQAWAYRAGMQSVAGHAAAERAAGAYARAVALAPLSALYLISAGSQALNLDDLGAATAYFTRAAQADPTAADAYAGLGEADLRRGDRSAARDELRRAERAGPNRESVRRLAAELGP